MSYKATKVKRIKMKSDLSIRKVYAQGVGSNSFMVEGTQYHLFANHRSDYIELKAIYPSINEFTICDWIDESEYTIIKNTYNCKHNCDCNKKCDLWESE